MQDPRTEIQEMITEMRESLREMEMKLWEVPHHDETDPPLEFPRATK